jgi:hypothetical protein
MMVLVEDTLMADHQASDCVSLPPPLQLDWLPKDVSDASQYELPPPK